MVQPARGDGSNHGTSADLDYPPSPVLGPCGRIWPQDRKNLLICWSKRGWHIC